MAKVLENIEMPIDVVDVKLRFRHPNPTAEAADLFIELKVQEGKTYGQARAEVISWYNRLINHPDTPEYRRAEYRFVVEKMTGIKERNAYEGMTLLFG